MSFKTKARPPNKANLYRTQGDIFHRLTSNPYSATGNNHRMRVAQQSAGSNVVACACNKVEVAAFSEHHASRLQIILCGEATQYPIGATTHGA